MKIQTVNNYINRNYQKRDVENVVSHQFNFVTNTIDLNSLGAFRTYAITSPSFRNIKTSNVEISLVDEQNDPEVTVELNINNKRFSVKQGLYPIYKMALHDQMTEELKENPELKEKSGQICINSKKISLTCPQEQLNETLKMIKDKFINVKIDPKHLDDAKKLAPVALFLNRKTGEYEGDFDDIPQGMSEEEYVSLISGISQEDINKYNKDILNNSSIKVKLSVNRNFYNKNKDEILQNLDFKNIGEEIEYESQNI